MGQISRIRLGEGTWAGRCGYKFRSCCIHPRVLVVWKLGIRAEGQPGIQVVRDETSARSSRPVDAHLDLVRSPLPLMDQANTGAGAWGLWGLVLAVILLGACKARPIPDSSPLLQFGGQVRLRHLYTDDTQETEAHLEIRADGTVVGTAHRSPESLLELKALKPGVIQILGIKTSRFLCQRPDGTLYGSLHFDPEVCSFQELLLEDGYNIYRSEALGLPLRLPPQDPAPWGPARFLPLPGVPPAPPEPPGILAPEPPDVGSSDPLSMVGLLQGRSPSYAS
ncbi:fibroblast growth factor 21 [Dipodomys spectabilis]|uniref:fibroblast growth factor 21 n=1 Tax=Dipodomys spectabilis TaxID=105255 RepID=UPI001C546CF5|nr:fibroblast growth factor 21 [Dipodomys spectabilis]